MQPIWPLVDGYTPSIGVGVVSCIAHPCMQLSSSVQTSATMALAEECGA